MKLWCLVTADQAEIDAGDLFLLLESLPTEARVVLVLRDATDAHVAQLLQRSQVREIVRTGPVGLSRARNLGLESMLSLGIDPHDLVSFPDDDCYHYPGLLNRIEEILESTPTVDLILGTYGESPTCALEGRALDNSVILAHGSSVGIYVRWGLLVRVGGFNEALGVGSGVFNYGEDIDYLLRAARLARAAVFRPDARVFHREERPNNHRNSKGYLTVLFLHLRDRRVWWSFARGVLSAPVQDVFSYRPPSRVAEVLRALSPRRLIRALRSSRRCRGPLDRASAT